MQKLAAVRFEVLGEPVAKGRARSRHVVTKAGREFTQTYTPKKTRSYAAVVALEAKLAMAGRAPLGGALVLLVHAYFSIPASWPQWKRRDARAGLIVPTGRPDWDNLGKVCSDAMNGIVYDDDSAVVDAVVRKRFATEPRVVIEVRTLNLLRHAEPELLDTLP